MMEPSTNTVTLIVRVGGYHWVIWDGIALSETPLIAKAAIIKNAPIPAMSQFSSICGSKIQHD
jgi:hypothetical protein